MKHGNKIRKLGREKGQRAALLKTLAANLILKEKITTTEAKAKETRPFVEKLITKGKKGDLSAIKYLAKYLPEKARKKIVTEIGPRFKERAGGYTRIIKLNPRKTDGAKMAIIELVA
ncbi:50S ribosomal protein L17 [Patescibacteria group bacterium]|nr:50S ribosomal protein L17 [Patescibacteria group bacterium]MBU2579409.1 50S ribosomal protein L17 [Patescibacteria group bacterium]MBU4030607.1 50S ribosomal protein L17 [Patescibacteria group bacterium]MBU4082622.1 50S ribosomal protein L17 [Patescibacteria group bacterium]